MFRSINYKRHERRYIHVVLDALEWLTIPNIQYVNALEGDVFESSFENHLIVSDLASCFFIPCIHPKYAHDLMISSTLGLPKMSAL